LVLGFNKQKLLSAAEKFVQQGSCRTPLLEYDSPEARCQGSYRQQHPSAISTRGLGDIPKPSSASKRLASLLPRRLTVKGIAMYKKITKLQPSLDSTLKLAELYTQQGCSTTPRPVSAVAEDS